MSKEDKQYCLDLVRSYGDPENDETANKVLKIMLIKEEARFNQDELDAAYESIENVSKKVILNDYQKNTVESVLKEIKNWKYKWDNSRKKKSIPKNVDSENTDSIYSDRKRTETDASQTLDSVLREIGLNDINSTDESVNKKVAEPSMAFVSVCNELNVDDIDTTFKQVNYTLRTYRGYLTRYKKALQNKNKTFTINSADKTTLILEKPKTRIWQVIPKFTISLDTEDQGWYICRDFNDDLEIGDHVQVSPGRSGSKTLDETNFRRIDEQYQFKFDELMNSEKIGIFNENYTVIPAYESLPDDFKISVNGRFVESSRIDSEKIEVFANLTDKYITLITNEGSKNVGYNVIDRTSIPSNSTPYYEGFIQISSQKPIGGLVKDVTNDVISNITPSELSIGGNLLSDLGFEKIGNDKFILNGIFDQYSPIVKSTNYLGLEFQAKIKQSNANWYSIELPFTFDEDSSADPREVIFQDNAIIKCNNEILELRGKNFDDMEIKLGKKGEDKPRDLGKNNTISVSFNTRDIQNQINAMNSLEFMPHPSMLPLINIFRKKEGKGNWPDFSPKKPRYGWRVLTDDSYHGVEEQRSFVKKALCTEDFAILDGPPGTGKTTAIRELIIQLILDGKRILVASSTNAAIDNVLDRIINIDCINEKNKDFKNKLRPIRLGIEERASDEVKKYTMETILKDLKTSGESEDVLKRILIDSSNLVCGTIGKVYSDLVGRNSHDMEWKDFLATIPKFDYMIMDESSKTTFQEFIVPAKLAKRWILAGDIKQLSPFTDEDAVKNALDIFSESDDECNVTGIEKAAINIINECNVLRKKSTNSVIIVNNDLAKEIRKQLMIIDKNLSEDISCLDQLSSYSDPHNTKIFIDLYRCKVTFIPSSIVKNSRNIIPKDSYVFDLSDEKFNLSLELFNFAYQHKGDKYEDSTAKDMERHSSDLRKTWAESISWRLNRDFWLRNTKQSSNHYYKEMYDRIPGNLSGKKRKEFFNKCFRTVQNVVFHSILELLTCYDGERDYQSLVQSFDEKELNLRCESLKYQHRMHPEISKTPSNVFYDKELVDGQNVKDIDIGYYLKGAPNKHLAWVNCSDMQDVQNEHTRKKEKRKRNTNKAERDRIEEELKRFIKWAKDHPKSDGDQYTVIVLTFYLPQKNEMVEQLKSIKEECKDYVRIKVATVDYIQGQEADIVFLSMVREDKNRIGFMDTPNRLNVAITRAKHLMVFVGYHECFKNCKSIELRLIAEGCNVY